MYLLGIDFETTGLSPETDQIIEVGAVVWDAEQKKPVEMFSKLVQVTNLPLAPKIIELTGITDEHLKNFGVPLVDVLEELGHLANKCDYLVGHNALGFDRKFLNNACDQLGKPRFNQRWIDTTIDINFPQEIKTRKLTYLAADHHFISPAAHRAAFDVMTMFQLVSRYDIHEICDRASSDLVQVIARVSFENKNLASENGFRWDPNQRTWSKSMRKYDIDKSKFPFDIQINETTLD